MGIFYKLFGKKSKKVVPEKRLSELASEAYTNKELGLSITPPKGWNIHEPDFGIVTFILGSVVFYAPMEKEVKEVGDLDVLLSEGVPHIKIFVVETDVIMKTLKVDDPYMILDKIAAEESEKSGETIFSIFHEFNRKRESKRKRNINNLDAYEEVFTIESEAEDITYCKGKGITIIEKVLAYSITFIVKEKDYDRYLPAFEKSIQTFQVGKPGVEAKIGFSITLPEGWLELSSKLMNIGRFTIFHVSTDKDKSAELEKLWDPGTGVVELEKFTKLLNEIPHIKIIVKGTDMTLDEFYEKAKKDLEQNPFVEVVSEQKITINGLDAYEYIQTLAYGQYYSFISKPEPTHMIKGACLVDKGRLYDINFVAPKIDYASHLPAFEKSIETFQIIGNGKK